MLPVSALNNIVHNEVARYQKKLVEKFRFSELKIEKVKFITQSQISYQNVLH